jgi:hypothetical protein
MFSIPAISTAKATRIQLKDIKPWTDTYSNLFQILK